MFNSNTNGSERVEVDKIKKVELATLTIKETTGGYTVLSNETIVDEGLLYYEEIEEQIQAVVWYEENGYVDYI